MERPSANTDSGLKFYADPFASTDDKPIIGEDDEAAHASGHSGDEWTVAEEFDVGPEFVRRQRNEEDRWKRKVEKWLQTEEEAFTDDFDGPRGWRWAIRDLVSAVGHSEVEGEGITSTA